MNPRNRMNRTGARLCLVPLALTALSACASVETGAVSPCHGQFRAEGQYFSTRDLPDGSQIVVSTSNGPAPGCAG
jgi:hypothetical protein